MEDIKILKEIIEHKNDYDYAFGTKIVRPYSIDREEIQAIENILNRLEQNEKLIKEMAEYIKNEWGFANKNEVIDHFRKKCE